MRAARRTCRPNSQSSQTRLQPARELHKKQKEHNTIVPTCVYEREPPAAVWQPNGCVPKIRKEGGGTNRSKYIEYFEEKVVCEEYSPTSMRRWDKSKFSKDSNFNSRLLQCYVAKNDLPTPGGKDSLDNIKKVGMAHAKDKHGGEEKFTRGGQLSCFEMHVCLSLCEGLPVDALTQTTSTYYKHAMHKSRSK